MNVTILSCGPSLRETYNPLTDSADEIVAINRAAEEYAHDWWAFFDKETILFRGNPEKGILTTNAVHRMIMCNPDLKRLWLPGWERMRVPKAQYIEWFSFVIAISVILSQWSPKKIDIYGMDLEGTKDFTGEHVDDRWDNRGDKRRSSARWNREIVSLRKIMELHPDTEFINHSPLSKEIFNGSPGLFRT